MVSATVLLTGEGDKKIPIVIIHNASIYFTNKKGSLKELTIEADKEVFFSILKEKK